MITFWQTSVYFATATVAVAIATALVAKLIAKPGATGKAGSASGEVCPDLGLKIYTEGTIMSETIKVKVTFAAADHPHNHEYSGTVPIGTVLQDAMAAFGVANDGTTRYYLKHDGDEVPVDKTVGDVAGHARALHLKLRTETIQGAS
jgi:hypothetical protein